MSQDALVAIILAFVGIIVVLLGVIARNYVEGAKLVLLNSICRARGSVFEMRHRNKSLEAGNPIYATAQLVLDLLRRELDPDGYRRRSLR